MIWALLLSFVLSLVWAVLWIGMIDREDARRRRRMSGLPTITTLPRAAAIPTAYRRAVWRVR